MQSEDMDKLEKTLNSSKVLEFVLLCNVKKQISWKSHSTSSKVLEFVLLCNVKKQISWKRHSTSSYHGSVPVEEMNNKLERTLDLISNTELWVYRVKTLEKTLIFH